MVSAQDVTGMAERAKQENAIFVSKAILDGSAWNGRAPIGREDKAWELVRALAGGLAQGYVPPLVFVYGRTGSGKSTVVRFVCESLPLSLRFVNLRRARTAFGRASLMLEGLGGPAARSGQSLGLVMEGIASALGAAAKERPLALVLDEFDALLSDRRGRASDLVYGLLDAQQGLREKGLLVCIIAISNNVMAAGELDDRVRPRIGSAPEVYFDAYSQKEIVAMLEDRARQAFSAPRERRGDREVRQAQL